MAPVDFRELPSGRQEVMLGAVRVGEIMPLPAGTRRHTHCYRLSLPDSAVTSWQPARDLDIAQWQVCRHVDEWLNAADLRPVSAP